MADGLRLTSRVWITRTQPGATASARAWAEAGFDPVIAPLLSAHPVQDAHEIALDAHLVFTSAHAVRHCGVNPDDRPVYTVGDATAEVARRYGFTQVVSAKGDWTDLLATIPNTAAPIVHLSGRVVRGALVAGLQKRGLNASRIVVYDTRTVEDWPLDPASVQAVAFYSPMAVQTFRALPARPVSHMTAYCLSSVIADGLTGLTKKIAHRPDEAALIACSRAIDL